MTEQLSAFFETLDSLTQRQAYDVSNVITFRRGSLYALISMGEVRTRVPVQELLSNPAKAVELVVAKWKWDRAVVQDLVRV